MHHHHYYHHQQQHRHHYQPALYCTFKPIVRFSRASSGYFFSFAAAVAVKPRAIFHGKKYNRCAYRLGAFFQNDFFFLFFIEERASTCQSCSNIVRYESDWILQTTVYKIWIFPYSARNTRRRAFGVCARVKKNSRENVSAVYDYLPSLSSVYNIHMRENRLASRTFIIAECYTRSWAEKSLSSAAGS